ncbi:hypothetical protein DCAR_0415964 [Daucus carota subsp. sativus]|uniref:Uncharacterized protein n=1 Tax=Daucus carota subsp. sativus TaxID=79200 RepID=A0A165WXV2_DAUCS|nr:hypothetical protein DCAR_0415964 [Daucus carota subsp. sativus]
MNLGKYANFNELKMIDIKSRRIDVESHRLRKIFRKSSKILYILVGFYKLQATKS